MSFCILTNPFFLVARSGLICLLLTAALAGCSWLDSKHRGWIYRPTPGAITDWDPISPREEMFFIDTPGTETAVGSTRGRIVGPDTARPGPVAPHRLRAIWIPQEGAQAPVVLYLHGTFRNVFQNRSKIRAIHHAGMAVLALEYRGWGDSTAIVPSEVTITEDAERAWSVFAQRSPDPTRRILFGHSMGAAVAVSLASRRRAGTDYGALVLESSFRSLPDVARDYSFLASLLAPLTTQQFDSYGRIPAIAGPIWFLTGTSDGTIPTQHTRDLFEVAQSPRHLILFEAGGHSRLHQEFPRRYEAAWRCIAASLRPGQDEATGNECLATLPDEQALPDR